MVAIVVASICTFIFGGNDPADIDSSLLTPWIRNRFHKKVREFREVTAEHSLNLETLQKTTTIPIETGGVIESSF